MRKIVMSAMLPAILAAAPAFAAEPIRFERDGVRYEYVVAARPDGRRVISGRNLSNGRSFRYLVAGGTVTGWSGSDKVSFAVPRPAERRTEIASN